MIKAIETRYKNDRFRSRLEARWAVFFNFLNIPYRYETEGYELGNGLRYLPDFWLPTQKIWLEIKGPAPSEGDSKKMLELCYGLKENGVIYFGQIEPPCEKSNLMHSIGFVYHEHKVYDAWKINNIPHGTSVVEKKVVNADVWHILEGPLVKCYPNFLWGQRPMCGGFDITYLGRGWHKTCPRWEKSAQSFEYVSDSPDLINAYRAARSARFEHGESG